MYKLVKALGRALLGDYTEADATKLVSAKSNKESSNNSKFSSFRQPEVVRQSKGLLGLEHLLTRGVHPYAAGSTISFAAAARTSTRELSLSPSRSKEANYSSVVSPK